MSLLRYLGIRSTVLSFLEVAVFFGVSVAAFYGLYELAATHGMPVWAWILAGAVYLLIVTIYWAPGDERQNEVELRAFVWFLAAALVIGGAILQIKYQVLSNTARTFWNILHSGG